MEILHCNEILHNRRQTKLDKNKVKWSWWE